MRVTAHPAPGPQRVDHGPDRRYPLHNYGRKTRVLMDFDGEMLERELREVEARARQAREELSALVVEAKSKDGLIELTVGSQGRLHALTFDPRVKRLPVEELAK